MADSGGIQWNTAIAGGVIGASSGVIFLLLLRKRVQSSLRQQLARLNVPMCTHCGYNLTGNVTGICPEMG